MQNKELYERNVILVFVYCFLRYAFFFIPFFTPFLLSNNLSYSQIFSIHFVFALCVLFLEVPLGYVADRFGRKIAMILGIISGYSLYRLHGLGVL